MLNTEDVMREMREVAAVLTYEYSAPYVVTNQEMMQWITAIEAAMREKETWLSPECYEELMRERQETLHEMAKLRRDIERLQTLLREARDDIREDVSNRYPWKDQYPQDMLRYERDMDIVLRINAALAGEDKA